MSGQHRPISVFLAIRSLDRGGAQRQLVELALGLKGQGHGVTVGVFYPGGPFLDELSAGDVAVVDLHKGGRWDTASFVRRLSRAIKLAQPDVIYSFVGTANIFAALLRPILASPKLVWSIRSSDMDLGRYDWAHRLAYRLECGLSGVPDLIIANSNSGLEFAAAHGFPRPRIAMVPNGIDTTRFRPNTALRFPQRAQWGLSDEQIAVGMLARLDPMKGYPDFLHAAAKVAARRSDVRFICIGGGPEEQSLRALAAQLGIAERVTFAGPTDDVVAALNGLDLFCSASITEGFSNAIAEAMACDLRCVVTDAGDSAAIVGDCGLVVPRSSPDKLAEAISQQIEAVGRGGTGAGRDRIVKEFSIAAMVDRTVALLQQVVGRPSGSIIE